MLARWQETGVERLLPIQAQAVRDYGFLQGYNPTAKLTIHHSLFANHYKRNPLISGIK